MAHSLRDRRVYSGGGRWVMLQRTLHETSTAETRSNKSAGSLAELFKHHKQAFVTVLGYTRAAR